MTLLSVENPLQVLARDGRLLVLMAIIGIVSILIVSPSYSFGSHNDFKYTLTINTEPAGLFYINGEGEYDTGTYATTGTAPSTWMGYEFVGWKVDGVMYAGNPIKVLMDEHRDAVAIYAKQQNAVTIDSYPRIASVIVDGIAYLPSDLPLRFEWDPSSKHTVIFPEEVKVKTLTRYVFDGWNDQASGEPSREITIDGAKTIRALFQTQYYLMVSSEYGKVTGSGWYNEGDIADISVSSQYVEGTVEGSRFAFAGWGDIGYTPNSVENQILIDKPTTVKAKWQEQYLLDLKSSIEGVELAGDGWYNKGSSAVIMAPQEFLKTDDEEGCKFTFTNWFVTGRISTVTESRATSNLQSINMNNPYTATAVWNELCYLAIEDPMGKVSGEGYYLDGSKVDLSLNTKQILATAGDDTRLVLYSLTIIPSSSTPTEVLVSEEEGVVPITIDGPMAVHVNWKKQYYLDISSSRGIVEGSGWYNEGSVAYLKIKDTRDPAGFFNQYKFANWEGDVDYQGTRAYVTMDGPKEIRAIWEEDVAAEALNAATVVGIILLVAILYIKRTSLVKQVTKALQRRYI